MALIGNYPTTPGFQAVNFKTISNTRQTTSLSGRRVRLSTAGTRFSATISYPPLTVAEFMPVQAIIAQCQGSLNSFDIILPTISYTKITNWQGQILVNGNQSQGDTTISVRAYDTDSTVAESRTILNAGDVIRFASHTKVYMATQDITTDGTGVATIDITPALFEDIVDGTEVTHDAVPFRMTLERDVQEFKYDNSGFVGYELDVLEEI